MSELHHLTALEQGTLIAAGALSPVDLTVHYLTRIEKLNDTVGAYVTVTADIALGQAERSRDAATAARRAGRKLPPLHGVPIPVKDSVHVAGVRTSHGSAALGDDPSTVDDHLVTRLKNAGTVLLGKTNTPEFELSGHTENRVAPPARTPWDPERSAGGSSGGAAAAVASGLAPAAHGSDSAGSIRGPASVCGLYGIKPSRGRVSTGPTLWDVSGLTTGGPLARTVADAAALLDALAGPMPGDPYAAPGLPPGEDFLGHAGRRTGPLRIGLVTEPTVPGVTVHPDCLAAAQDAAELLTGLGHLVEPARLPADASLGRAFPPVWAVLAALRPVPPGNEARLMPFTRHLRAQGAAVTGTEFAAALHAFRAIGRRMAEFHTAYDVLLTPTLAEPPQAVGALRNEEDPAAEAAATVARSPFTALYNVTGQPAVSLPLYWTAAGLPIGVMLAGRYGEDAALISLSAQLEAARPWAGRTPPVW